MWKSGQSQTRGIKKAYSVQIRFKTKMQGNQGNQKSIHQNHKIIHIICQIYITTSAE
jgi:hypothetical protein